MATNKRTVIGADEELLVKGQLVVTGNVTQIETTQTINRLESDELIINSDSDAVTAKLQLNGNSDSAVLSYNSTNGTLSIDKEIVFPTSTSLTVDIVGDVTGQVSDISNHSTSDLSEGSNLYYTDARADARATLRINASTTDNIDEGSSNLYFTDARARASIDVSDNGGDGLLAYNSSTGVITYTGPSPAEVRAHLSAVDAGGDGSFAYNSGTCVFTYTGPSASEVRSHLSVTDAGGDGSFAYNSGTGVFTYTGPSSTEARAHFSAGTGLTYSGGQFSITDTGVSSNTYGSSNDVARFTVNDQGQITSASEIAIDHDALLNFVANEHIDHSGVTLTAGDGLSGGGTIAASRSFAVDGTVLRTSGNQSIAGTKTFTGVVDLTGATVTVQTEANTDSDFSVASTAYVNNRINQVVGAAPSALDTLEEIAAAMGNSSNIGGVVTSNTNRIGALEGRVITAGDGLTGGGNLSGDRSIDVDATVARTSTNMFAGSGLTGGGTLAADRTFNIGAGTGITVNANDIDVDMTAFDTGDLAEGSNLYYTDTRADARVNLQTGTNLDLSAKDTDDLAEGSTNLYYTDARVDAMMFGGDGLTYVNGGTFAVDATVIRNFNNQSIGGIKTFTGALVVPNSSSTTAGAIYYDSSGTEAYIYIGGSARKITPAVDAGDLEAVGTGTFDVYAGTRVDGSTTYHGIKSLDRGTYTSISESGNVITIDGDISTIRQAFSASGTTLSYNNNTGAFSSTADNYDNWSFTTPTGGSVNINSGDELAFSAGSGIGISHSGKTVTITNTNAADITAVTAGDGLGGGGLTGAVTLNVGAGDGISVNTNDVAVDSTVVRTSGTQSIAGNKTLTGSTQINALSMNGAYSLPVSDGSPNQVLSTDGNGNLSFVAVSTIGGTVTGVTAGAGLTGGGLTGTVNLDVGAGDGIDVQANDVAVDNTVIRTTGNQSIGGNLEVNGLTLSDNESILLGDDGDLKLHHDTSDSIVEDVGTGSLLLKSNGLGIKLQAETGGTYYDAIQATAFGTTLHTQGAVKLTTTASGITVTGTVDVNSAYTLPTSDGSPNQVLTTNGGGAASFATPSTSNITEGSNLYYTNERVDDRVSNLITAGVNVALTYDDAAGTLEVRVPYERIQDTVGEQLVTNGSHTGVAVSYDDSGDAGIDIAVVPSYIRGLLSSGSLISYDSTSGQISTTADNYGSWSFDTSSNGTNESVTSGDIVRFSAGTGMQVNHSGDTITFTNTAPDQTVSLSGTGSVNVSGTYPNFSISGTDTNTTYSAGTDLSLAGTQFNVVSSTAAGNNTLAKRDGSGNLTANVFNGVATSARYADLAEKYESDANYQAGTVVVFGGEKEITVTNQANSPRVAGVISTDPAYMMNSEADGQYVALRGRVPCKVIGPVKKGDVLITSSRPGFAETSSDPAFVGAACIVGKALGEWDSPSEGVVEIVV